MFLYKKPTLRSSVLKGSNDKKKKNALKRVHDFLEKYEKEIIMSLLFAWDTADDDAGEYIDEDILSDGYNVNIYEQRIRSAVNNLIIPTMHNIGQDGFNESYNDIRNLYPVSGGSNALPKPKTPEPVNLPTENDAALSNMFDYNVVYDDWCENRAASLIVELTEGQRENVRQIINSNLHNIDSAETVKRIKDTVGLTSKQLAKNQRYYESVLSQQNGGNLNNPPKRAVEYAEKAAKRMADKQRTERAKSIARTEINAAHHSSNEAYMRWAIEHGYVKGIKRRWATSGNDNVCPICLMLEGQTVDFDEDFNTDTVFFGNQKRLPPAHPNCCCGIIYEEK